MAAKKQEWLPQASEEEFLTREERPGIKAADSWKRHEPAHAKEPALDTLSVEEHLAGLWKFLGLSVRD